MANLSIEAVCFSRETYCLIESFECGDSDYAKLCEDWIKGVPPHQCAFLSIEKRKTRVWIFTYLGVVIGYGSLGPNKFEGKTIGYIPMFAVASDYQSKEINGQRVSKFIINFLLDKSRELDWPRVCLMVGKENEKAIRLYRSMGFSSFKDLDKFGNMRMCIQLKIGAPSIS